MIQTIAAIVIGVVFLAWIISILYQQYKMEQE